MNINFSIRRKSVYMDKDKKVIHINEIDERVAEQIRDMLSTAIAKSIARQTIKEVCGENAAAQI